MGRPSTYPAEFGEQAVELVRASGRTVAEVVRDLSTSDTTLGDRVEADLAGRGAPDDSGLLPLTAAEASLLEAMARPTSVWGTVPTSSVRRRAQAPPSSRRWMNCPD